MGIIWNVDIDIFFFKTKLNVKYWKAKALSKNNFPEKQCQSRYFMEDGVQNQLHLLCIHEPLMLPFLRRLAVHLVNSSIERKKKNFLCLFPRCLEISPTFIYLLKDNALPGKVAVKCLYKVLKTQNKIRVMISFSLYDGS